MKPEDYNPARDPKVLRVYWAQRGVITHQHKAHWFSITKCYKCGSPAIKRESGALEFSTPTCEIPDHVEMAIDTMATIMRNSSDEKALERALFNIWSDEGYLVNDFDSWKWFNVSAEQMIRAATKAWGKV